MVRVQKSLPRSWINRDTFKTWSFLKWKKYQEWFFVLFWSLLSISWFTHLFYKQKILQEGKKVRVNLWPDVFEKSKASQDTSHLSLPRQRKKLAATFLLFRVTSDTSTKHCQGSLQRRKPKAVALYPHELSDHELHKEWVTTPAAQQRFN